MVLLIKDFPHLKKKIKKKEQHSPWVMQINYQSSLWNDSSSQRMLAVCTAANKEKKDKCRALLLQVVTAMGKPRNKPHTHSGFIALTLKGFKKCLLESSFRFSSTQGSFEGRSVAFAPLILLAGIKDADISLGDEASLCSATVCLCFSTAVQPF